MPHDPLGLSLIVLRELSVSLAIPPSRAPPGPRGRSIPAWLPDQLLALFWFLAVFYMTNGLAGLRFGPTAWAGVTAVGTLVALGMGQAIALWPRVLTIFRTPLVLTGGGFVMAFWQGTQGAVHALGFVWSVYLGIVVGMLTWGTQAICRRFASGETPGKEYFRVAGLVAMIVALYHPYLTTHMLGGLDARWYGYVVADVLQQLRAGILPVFVGQGEFMYNGAVHPYRTAPMFTFVTTLLDFASVRALSALALQHLLVVVSALSAAFTAYLCLGWLAGRHRWLAWLGASLYCTAPVPLVYINASEMYMTFMAFTWLPVAFYGSIRVIQRDDLRGWLCLVAGLSMVWLCHAPVAIWSTIVIAGIQAPRLLIRDFHWRAWRRAMAGGIATAALLVFYFYSISELGSTHVPQEAKPMMGAGLLVAGLALFFRFLGSGRWAWFIAGLSLAILAWWAVPWLSGWLVLAWILAALVVLVDRHVPGTGRQRRALEWSAALLLVSGCAIWYWLASGRTGPPVMGDLAYNFMKMQFPGRFTPLDPGLVRLDDLQMGYSALALLAICAGVLVYNANWEIGGLAIAGLLLTSMLAPVPLLSRWLYHLVPLPIYGVCSPGLWLRFQPALLAIVIFGGLAALLNLHERVPGAWARATIHFGLLCALAWNGMEAMKPLTRAKRAVGTELGTASFYRTENAALYYAYDRLPHPRYSLHGISDYHLESRLLDASQKELIPDPRFAGTGDETVMLSTVPNEFNPDWFPMSPSLKIEQGEHMLMRFDFFPKAYNGILTMDGPGFQRAYYLPDGGSFEKSFGVAPSRPKDLAVWNTGKDPLDFSMLFMADPATNRAKPFGDFAKLHVTRFRPGQLQVKTLGLLPYRAEVSLAQEAYLETPRVFIPGYEAKVNGRPVDVQPSPDYLAMIHLPAGTNLVELRFAGTRGLWVCLVFSGIAWLGLGALVLRLWRRPSRDSHAFSG